MFPTLFYQGHDSLFLTDTICPVAQKSNYDEDKVPLSQVAFSFSVRPLYGPKLHNFKSENAQALRIGLTFPLHLHTHIS